MLVAFDGNKQRHLAWETSKDSAPFLCPACNEQVLLRKGKIRIPHFSHKPPVSCKYGTGESEQHFKVKKAIYEALKDLPNCRKCEMERPMDSVRPDVSLYIDNVPVAIEIQKSTIDVREIERRVRAYSSLGVYLLWVIPESFASFTFREKEEAFVHKMKEWEKYLHALAFGRVYYWQREDVLRIYHFGELMIEKESASWFDSSGNEQYAGGYEYRAKTLRLISEAPKYVKISESFKKMDRTSFRAENWTIPASKIYVDTVEQWWKK